MLGERQLYRSGATSLLIQSGFNPPLTVYFLNCEDAFSKAFFIDAHAVSTPVCMCCHADSLAARISCNSCSRRRGSLALPFVHGQYFRELEFASLLVRVTRWSADPSIYAEAATLVAPLWNEWWRIQMPPGPAFDPNVAYAAVAFGHALLARIRLTPVLGNGVDELDPFVAAIRRIEQENGRMLQTQIRLLKDSSSRSVSPSVSVRSRRSRLSSTTLSPVSSNG